MPSRERLPRAAWNRLRRVVLARDGGRCVQCRVGWRLEVDHVRPLERGGSNDLDNLQTLCRGHHIAKTRAENFARTDTPERAAWRALTAELLEGKSA